MRILVRSLGRAAAVFLLASSLSASAAIQEGYVDPVVCRSCHPRVYDEYKKTPMGESFYRPDTADLMAYWEVNNTFYHPLSDRHYEMTRRGDKLFIGRYQLDKWGRRVNVLEKQVTYVIGSGELVRIYLHQAADGRIIELPVAWYGQEGRWGMPPGYDQPNHPGFTRRVNHKCMFCHNGYPEITPSSDLNRWGEDVRFTGWIPMGIDCQRCHGPGEAHLSAIKTGSIDEVRDSIVNPARLSEQRQLEVCLQCHMETTTFFLPDSHRRFGRGIHSYRPGEPLSDYIVHFDHAPGTGHDDKFQIGSSAYRLRKSVCFTASGGRLVCTTCHNPHNRPQSERRASHYRSRCFTCHTPETGRNHEMTAAEFTASDCVSCHMPHRRTEDGVHVVVTDHMIQKNKPARDLLAPLRERTYEEQLYRGEVVIYFPEEGLEGAERDVYLGVAQVKDGANLEPGVKILEKALRRTEIRQPEPYYELAEAQVKLGRRKAARGSYLRALEIDPSFVQARNNLGLLLAGMGKIDDAIDHYRRARLVNPGAAEVHNNLGIALLKRGAPDAAKQAFRDAIAADPLFYLAHLNLGKRLFLEGRIAEAKEAFERTLAIEPAQVEAHNNLGLVLMGLGNTGEAVEHLTYALEKGVDDVKESARKALQMLQGNAPRHDKEDSREP